MWRRKGLRPHPEEPAGGGHLEGWLRVMDFRVRVLRTRPGMTIHRGAHYVAAVSGPR
jgi:hypothetical protein